MIVAGIVYLVQKKLPPYVKAKPLDIQVLTDAEGASRSGKIKRGSAKYLNPQDAKKKEKENGKGLFREGDKVMQIRNNYQLEWKSVEVMASLWIKESVFSMVIWVPEEINTFAETLTVVFEENRYVEYSFKQLDELEHLCKSQYINLRK